MNGRNKFGGTPLHYAARDGQVRMARMLVSEFGAEVNVKDKAEWTPLHFAAYNGQVEVVRLFASEFGADVMAKDNEGRRPRDAACERYLEGDDENIKKKIEALLL